MRKGHSVQFAGPQRRGLIYTCVLIGAFMRKYIDLPNQSLCQSPAPPSLPARTWASLVLSVAGEQRTPTHSCRHARARHRDHGGLSLAAHRSAVVGDKSQPPRQTIVNMLTSKSPTMKCPGKHDSFGTHGHPLLQIRYSASPPSLGFCRLT